MTATLYESGVEVLSSRKTGEPLLDMVMNDADVQTAQMVNAGRITATPDLVNVLDGRVINKLAVATRECIEYSPGTKPWHSSTEGDCYSFTYALDELGELLGYERRVVFCNGHAFNFYVNRNGDVHMLNGETPHMQIADTAHEHWARRMLMNHHFEAIANQSEPAQWLSLETQWLRFYSEAAQHGQSRKLELPWLNAHLPAMTVMTPEYGLPALRNYSRFNGALNRGDLAATTVAVTRLGEANPQAETRTKINDQMVKLERNVRTWARDPSIPTEAIVECLALFDAMMPVKTKSLSMFMGDSIRDIAQLRNDSELGELSLAYYRDADKRSNNRDDRTLFAKMRRAREAAAGYDGASQQSRFVGKVAFSSLLVV